MDKIKIRGLLVFAFHGVYEEEKQNGQDFTVDADLYIDSRIPALNDNIDNAVNYGEVALWIKDYVSSNRFDLMESLTNSLAADLLAAFPGIKRIRLEIHKPNAPIPTKFDDVSVEVVREWTKAYISYGSNMGERETLIDKAWENLSKDKYIRNIKLSEIMETKPYGGVEQDDFLNGAAEIETLYSPYKLLERLHEEEAAAGRERLVHWGPRTLDLDIVYYGDEIIDTENLTIPHADMANREFVLKPLMEIAPNKKHPVSGLTTSEMLDKLKE